MSCYNKTKHVRGEAMEKIQRVIEVERVVNLVKGFGWDLKDTKVEGETITIIIEKKVAPVMPVG